MTHTIYNRDRGLEETKRFLEILLKGIDPFREYARRHGLAIHLEGIREGYELEQEFNRAFPMPSHPKFDAHFLLDYEEEWFLSPDGRALLEALPPIDVVVRHTKLGISGGWIFFFQAEDGIRYVAVTGVQTCALPISRQETRDAAVGRRHPRHRRAGPARDLPDAAVARDRRKIGRASCRERV